MTNRRSTARFCRILAALAVLAAAPVRSQIPPRLVADIKTVLGPPNAYPAYNLTAERLGGAVYFFADDGRHGREIWRTDGTAAGTALFADLCPGTCSFDGVLTRVDERLFAFGKDGSGGLTLFSLDGTAAGTRVARRFPTASEYALGRPVAFDGHLWWMMAELSPSRSRLWQSDGTFDGTRAVELPGCAEGCTMSFPGPLVAGNVLYFAARDQLSGAELWRTDGTAAGTFRTTDLCPGPCNGVANPYAVVAGGRLFFAGNDGDSGDEVWTIGGGDPAPRLVADFTPGQQGSAPYYPFAIGNEVYFILHTAAEARLYRTTGDGFTAVSEYEPYGAERSLGVLYPDGDRVFFSAIGLGGTVELWVRGPGSQPSRKLAGDLSSLIFLGSVNGTAFFYAYGGSGTQLWATDATPAGTRRVGSWRAAFPPPGGARAVGGGLLLLLDDGVHGYEPWISDGTVAGTIPLGDLNPESSSNPGRFGGFAALGSYLYFAAFDGSDLNSPHLFRASGNPPTVASAQVGPVSEIETAGGHAFALRATQPGLVATDAVTGPVVVSTGYPGRLKPWGDLLAFGGPTDFRTLKGQGLWVSDGTAAGTRLVFDAYPDYYGSGGDCLSPYYECEFVLYPAGLTPVGPSLYFIGYPEYGPDGEQLFRTDGTAAGTVALLPTNVDAAERSFQSLLPYGKGVAFVTLEETYVPQSQTYLYTYELWASDGAPESTRLLLSTSDRLLLLGAAGNRLLFGRRPVGSVEDELWASDGTAAGTALLSRLAGAGHGSRITGESTAPSLAATLPGTEVATSIVVGDRVFFTVVDHLTGEELWTSDGTAAGTRRVADIFAGAAGSHPTDLTPYRACAVFAASDGASGHELWASDGTKAWQVSDIAPGSGASNPGPMAAAGAFFYFAADDGAHGRELFAIPTAALDVRCSGAPPPPPPPPPPGAWLSTPEVPGFRFKVQLGTGDTAVAGTQADCVAATLCVAGARADRAEVLARVVGPKPNGRLWPTLIALTPTEVQVWVEQVGTGEIRYYRLPAAGGSTLAGLIDRTGFASQAGAAAVVAGNTAGVAADPSGWLTTPELPGFRFRVQIFRGDGQPQSIRLEPCLKEALCVSGAVPGRPEVFVRVTGARPNGRRWVALARLTISRVEIDVEQIAGGETHHYSLPGLAPASDRIEGLLDRAGFRP